MQPERDTESIQEPHTQPERWPERLLKKIPLERFRNPPPVVNVLRLAGVISSSAGGLMHAPGLNLNSIEDDIKKAFEDKKVKCVALQVNSPGGSPVQSELLYRRIRALSKEKNIPVVAFVEEVAASGGYWLACAGDEIIVTEASVLGSIGVVSSGFGFVETIKKLGVERRIYTQGKNKAILDPFKPEKESDIAILNNVMKALHDRFKDIVRERRQGKIQPEDEDTLFNGEFWAGKQSIELGLADSIGELYEVMRERYGEQVKFRKIISKKSWLRSKLGLGAYGGAKALANALADTLEERSLWGRFGL